MKKSTFLIVGKHAVLEALKNPHRKIERVFLTEDAQKKVNRENQTGNSYDFLLANYYDTEANYRNRVLGNIERSKFNYLQGTLPAIDNQYASQSTYVPQVNSGYNALNSGLTFASSYYDYKSKQNRFETNVDPYDYGTSESLYYDGWED